MDTQMIILLITPYIIIQIILMVINLINIRKKQETKYLNKPIWIGIILLFQVPGNLAYMLIENGDEK